MPYIQLTLSIRLIQANRHIAKHVILNILSKSLSKIRYVYTLHQWAFNYISKADQRRAILIVVNFLQLLTRVFFKLSHE